MNSSVPAATVHLPHFDSLRLLFAVLVVFSHSFGLIGFADPLQSVVGTIGFGGISVDGFFLISGYLITKSWISDPALGRFMGRRALRIYPAFIVASILSVFVVGPLGANPTTYFHQLDLGQFFRSALVLRDPHTPRVFAGTSVELVNGSMWTISFEFRCYLLAALLGIAGVLCKRHWVLALSVLLGVAISFAVPATGLADPQHLLFGLKALRVSDSMAWFMALFLAGSCFYLFRDKIRYTLLRWLIAVGVLFGCMFSPELLRPGILLAGAYVVFGAAAAPSFRTIGRGDRPDLSYGMYLYAWPVQKLSAWYWPHISPWVLFAMTVVLCAGLAWASWNFIEEPAMRFKPRGKRPVRGATSEATDDIRETPAPVQFGVGETTK